MIGRMARLALVIIIAMGLAGCAANAPEVVVTEGFVAISTMPEGSMQAAAMRYQPMAASACARSGQGQGAQYDRSVINEGRWILYYLCG
jgi:hypothetical protein